ncbi:MAG: septal ring lytic transglycosylase RlpA family protein [Acidiferrobacterales bacterium]
MTRILAVLVAIAVLSACSSRGPRYYQDDGPGTHTPDVSRIPDAVPRAEPLSASGNNPYVVFGHRYVPLTSARGYHATGVASWYGRKFHGQRTSNGERYDMYSMTAAHRTLPLPSYVRVRNLANNRQVIVRVNDRGPFLHNRLIDLSYAAAAKLGVIRTGTAKVEVTAVNPGDHIRENPNVAVNPIENPPGAVEVKPLPPSHSASIISNASAAERMPAQRPATPGANAEPGVYLQVGSFSVWDNAIKMRNRLEQANVHPVTIATVRVNSGRYFRVRVGPLQDLGAAEKIDTHIKGLGISGSRVVIE